MCQDFNQSMLKTSLFTSLLCVLKLFEEKHHLTIFHTNPSLSSVHATFLSKLIPWGNLSIFVQSSCSNRYTEHPFSQLCTLVDRSKARVALSSLKVLSLFFLNLQLWRNLKALFYWAGITFCSAISVQTLMRHHWIPSQVFQICSVQCHLFPEDSQFLAYFKNKGSLSYSYLYEESVLWKQSLCVSLHG